MKSNSFIFEDILSESNASLIQRAVSVDGKSVLLKSLKPTNSNISIHKSIKAEFDILSIFDNENIIKPSEIIEQDGNVFLVLENFDGISLKQTIQEKKLSIKEVLSIGIKISKALEVLFKKNVIHLRICPSNILYNQTNNKVKLTGFSNSIVSSKAISNSFNSSNGIIDLVYVSPEQTGRIDTPIDFRSDYYSLGITLYHLFVGYPPFRSSNPSEIIHQHIAKRPDPITDWIPEFPKSLSNIIEKLLKKSVDERYQSINGILADLEKCFHEVEEFSKISDFEIGKYDKQKRFEKLKKLYGRKNEIKIINNCYNRIIDGNSELLLVSGEAGSGKSALVAEIRKTVIAKNGTFVSGKFEQFNRNIPYEAVSTSFSELIKRILTENESKIKEWKKLILNALGDYGKIIIDVIPDLELIIGEQANLPDMSPIQEENRVKLLFKNFVNLFCTSENPFVLFLDDLQWADLSSLSLIEELLVSGKLNNFLLIGCYRTEEVKGKHPLISTIRNIEKVGVLHTSIKLKLLNQKDVANLLSDSLDIKKNVENLASLCIRKTNGNPFYLNSYLKFLYEEGYLYYSGNKCMWKEEEIVETQATENVAMLMKRKIEKLPVIIKEILKTAACIGNLFDVALLSKIMNYHETVIISNLNLIIVEGLIVHVLQNKSRYKYKFAHDKIHLVAYNLLETDERKIINLKIGNALLEYEENISEILFDAITHLNMGRDLLKSNSEKRRLIELNFLAGKKAKSLLAYDSAHIYFNIAFEFIEECVWQNDFTLCKELHEEYAELLYILGKFEEMESIAEIILANVSLTLDRVRIHEILIRAKISQSYNEEAISIALSMFRQLGINFPTNPSQIQVPFSMLRVFFALIGKREKLEYLKKLPEMEDKTSLAIMRIALAMGSSCYMAKPNLLVLLMVKLILVSIKNGNSAASGQVYITFGLILSSGFGMIDLGYRFGKLGMKILQNFNSKEVESTSSFLFSAYISHWKKHLNTVLDEQKVIYKKCLDDGNNEFAAYCITSISSIKFLTGKNLNTLSKEITEETEIIKNLKQINVYHENLIFTQATLILAGIENADKGLSVIGLNEDELLAKLKELDEKTTLFSFYFLKAFLAYIIKDYKSAEKWIEFADIYFQSQSGSIVHPIYIYYLALIKLSVVSESDKKKSKLSKINKLKKNLRKWSFHAPQNNLHRYYLIEAEFSKENGDYSNAIKFYGKAIATAKENKYLIEEAIANELASKFYFANNQKKIGNALIKDAYLAYHKWGAKLKTERMVKDFPKFLLSETRTEINNSQIRNSGEELDKVALIKMIESFFGEKDINKLISTIMKIFIETAGAETGCFLLAEKNDLIVSSKGRVNKAIEKINFINFEETDYLPKTIINYCKNTKETILINDVQADTKFNNDKYLIEKKPRSILCSPLVQQNRLVGIYYLENRNMDNAFKSDKIEILNLLSTQMASSIENARLYSNIEQKVNDRTKKIENELNQAADYVINLLPEKLDGKIKTDWKFVPSNHVSGDSFGYEWIDKNNFALYIIDVSGHGLEAALLSTSILEIIKLHTLPNTDFKNPAMVLNNLNKKFDMETHNNKFFSIWYGVIDTTNYELVCSSAFHPPATVVRNTSLFSVGKKDVMIGAFQDYNFENTTFQLNKGDVFYLYSDGCFEFETLDNTNLEFDDFQSLISKRTNNSNNLNNIYNSLLRKNILDNFNDDYSMIEFIL